MISLASLVISMLTPAIAIEDSFLRGASTNPVLDAESLRRQELSIVSSLRDDSRHRSLQAGNCMEDLKGSSLGCNSGDVEFVGVTGVVVYDEGAYLDTDGIWKGEKYKRLSVFSVRLCQTVETDTILFDVWKGACRGKDDYVNLAFTADINLGASRYDIGMYINTEGGEFVIHTIILVRISSLSSFAFYGFISGSARTGTCALSLLSSTNFQRGAVPPETIAVTGGTVTIGELEGNAADYCPDFTHNVQGGATLKDYPFSRVRSMYMFADYGIYAINLIINVPT